MAWRSCVAAVAVTGMLGCTRAEAAESELLDEVRAIAWSAADEMWADPALEAILRDESHTLPWRMQEYEVVELADLADPAGATMTWTTGAILLTDPAAMGELVMYRLQNADGSFVRDAEGRFHVEWWYEQADGRPSRVLFNADGEGVGSYTLATDGSGYELNLDLDGDRVVDVRDIVTGGLHEQITLSAAGRVFATDYLDGFNPLCDPAALGGPPGIPGFGATSDPRANGSACTLRRGARAGGFAGSLGSRETTPLDDLCASLSSGDSGAADAFRKRLDGGTRADGECNDTCNGRYAVCAGACGAYCDHCGPMLAVCKDACVAETDAAGTTDAAPEATPNSSATADAAASSYYDTDGDGRTDTEDTNDDGTPDTTCAAIGCGAEQYPPPFDDLGGQSWDELCRHDTGQPDTWGGVEAAAADCIEPKEAGKAEDRPDVRFADCFDPPKEVSIEDMLRDGSGNCKDDRGCEPNVIAKLRSLLAQVTLSTLSFYAQCINDPACQPPVDH